MDLPEHVSRNRELWDSERAAGFRTRARKQWAAEPHWRLWAVPQTELAVLPENLAGKDVIELGCGNAERVPYPDNSFDFAVSEHGAAARCDPYSWIPEAARLLRPGGERGQRLRLRHP